jgi:translation initiation factor 4G
MAPMSRGGSRRGGDARNDYNQPGADGWTTAGGGAANAPRPPPSKVGDLTMFGKINKAGPASFGPSAAFKKTEVVKRDSGNLSRTASSSNMYAALAGGTEVSSEPPLSRGSQPPSRKPSADFTQTGIPDAAGSVRRRLKLLPRSIPVASEGADPKDETEGGDSPAIQTDSEPEEGEIRDEEDGNVGEDVPAMSDEEAMRKIKEDVKELFSIRNLEDSAEYFSVLPVQYHSKLVDKIVTQVLDLKEKDAQFVAQYFTSVREKDLCSLTSFEEGFVGSIEFLEDISVDVPAAYKLVAILLKGAQLPDDALERLADKVAVDGEPLKPPREKLLDEVRKLN